jgi:two-component system CheB/CheR fusion protein
MEIISFYGDTSPYLSPQPGEASLNLMKMAKPDLTLELQTALFLARKDKSNIKRERIRYKHNGNYGLVNFEIIPIDFKMVDESYFVIIFDELSKESEQKVEEKYEMTDADETARSVNEELRKELDSTKENLQTIIEEQEATNEELRSALEEVQSSNEELQSTNEELETAKEELQSTNEELNTLNEELGRRNSELTRMKDDLNNLFNNIDIGVLVLNRDLEIRLFTPTAEKMFSIISSDLGRPIGDIRLKINLPDLDSKAKEVMENLSSIKQKVSDKDGRSYQMMIRP